MPDTITVDGVDLLSEFGAYIFPHDIDSSPEREVDTYEVPGRHGSVLGVGSRLKNVDVSYDAVIPQDGSANLAGLRSFLVSRNGYIRIDDPADPDHYRMGMFNGPFRPVLTKDRSKAKGLIVFDCQPQKWLTEGEVETTYTADTIITNPTYFQSKPLLKIWGSGTVSLIRVGGGEQLGVDVIILSDVYSDFSSLDHIDVDCESMNAYGVSSSGSVIANVNNYVEFHKNFSSFYNVDAPVLYPGKNSLDITTGITQVKITPRYWEA